MPDTESATAAPAAPRRARARTGNGTRLVIVESPAKAKKIAGFLGEGYVVESSIGHIRDLPRNAADVPAQYKGQAWARLGVDVDNDFATLYVVSADKKQQVSKLKALLKDADELFLATDEDREGEAIAWHLLETLEPKVPVRRMVFHEITPQAIQHAVETPRELDRALVDAQETRRVLDRLYGYEVSPVLWKKVMPKLSAGRVQSVATRVVVQRERERMAFRQAEYWDVEGTFTAASEAIPFPRHAEHLDGRRLATGSSFEQTTGQLKDGADVVHLDEASARSVAERLATASFSGPLDRREAVQPQALRAVHDETLQQEAGRKLRFSAQRTMQTAQRLYENGYITYMRTDSSNLSETAVSAARSQARDLYGPEYVPDAPRRYASKSKNAQEAHEAIRPAGEVFKTPGELARELSGDELRLYELIWQRTVASQMADAKGFTASVRLGAVTQDGTDAEFSASGRVITFPGFLRAYVESTDDDGEKDDAERRLPRVATGDALGVESLDPSGHTTSAPARYTEASLVKRLEELGIGRPSTYASIITTVQDRGYVWKKGSALVPTWLAFAVVTLLEQHFERLVDYGFTASLEDDLDVIAGGEGKGTTWLSRFYFGSDEGKEGGLARQGGLKAIIGKNLDEIDARAISTVRIGATDDGRPVVVRVGRYGPYVQVGEDGSEDVLKASLPEDLAPDELTVDKAFELASAPSGDRVLGPDPTTGYDVVAKAGRYGPYVSLVLPDGVKDKPPTASLFASMDLETLTLEQALKLLTLPRTLGEVDGEEVTAQNGRYGPYVSRGKESRSLESEEQLFDVTLEQALALLAQPKQYGRKAAAPKPPLKELGPDPVTGKPMVVKEGRFGPYVTDGEGTNASLRKGDTPEGLTDERAAELLAERRARGPAPKKAPAKRAPAKKSPAKKAAKKAPAKKA